MVESSPKKRNSVIATVGAAILALVAVYFGVDLGGNSSAEPATTATATSTGTAAPATVASTAPGPGLPACGDLPAEAEDTATDIVAGGPYAYPDNDNRHFGNYEDVLPEERSDYYREYTVDTPGLNHRGARRIVTGGGTDTNPDVWYYTDDHYETFCEITDAL